MLDKNLLEFDDCFEDGIFLGDFDYGKKRDWDEITRQVQEAIIEYRKNNEN